MYRRGPPKSASANVQCRSPKLTFPLRHYSYECKATTQERPYVPRPSRTQQLFNPKLVPKLTETAPVDLQKKQGVADQVLAKREAERAKKRELERDDEESESHEVTKRRRSPSYDSVSTISTRGSGQRASRSPSPARHTAPRASYTRNDHRKHLGSSGSDRDVQLPAQDARSSRSPSHGARYDDNADFDRDYQRARPRRASSSVSRSRSRSRSPPPPATQGRFRSRSPRPSRRRGDSPPRNSSGRRFEESRQQRRYDDGPRGQPSRREQRQRSPSPFSKRLALTQSMNMGR